MKLKTVITAVLLGYVGITTAYWVVNEVRAPARAAGAADAARTARPDRVTVYYFHGAARCENCVKFEAYSHEALIDAFPGELADGRLQWRVVDVEQPENDHFVQDYQLTSKAVVAAQFRAGKQKAWKDLEEIWSLVDDKAAFKTYIQDGVRALLTAE